MTVDNRSNIGELVDIIVPEAQINQTALAAKLRLEQVIAAPEKCFTPVSGTSL